MSSVSVIWLPVPSISNVKCQVSWYINVESQMSWHINVKYQMSCHINVKCQMSWNFMACQMSMSNAKSEDLTLSLSYEISKDLVRSVDMVRFQYIL